MDRAGSSNPGMHGHWDTIVIGSGAGGLTAAVALARAGQRVLVLEQHYLPGGWCHSFSLGGHRFSPGVHYLGALGPGGDLRRVYEGLGLTRDLSFNELSPKGFDHFLIAGQRFDVPRGFERWLARLCERFPHERAGIARYFGVLRAVHRELLDLRASTLLDKLRLPFRAPHLLRWGLSTQQALLDETITDPMLAAVLAAQSGNHGLAPSRVSLPLHASMIAHYEGGAYYPRGGAKRIPLAMIKALRAKGGSIRLRARVRRILVEKDRAIGVELEGGERIGARDVVSNADPAVTFGKLLEPPHGEKERRKVARSEYSVSTLSLFATVEMDLRARGFDSGNYWFYRHDDVGALYERLERRLLTREVDGLFLAVSSLKDATGERAEHAKKGDLHTIEMFTFVPHAPFARWEGKAQGERGADYEYLKESLGEAMLAAAEEVIPGLRKALRFHAVGTPLTNGFYCETPFGASYGTAKTPRQLGPFSFSIESSVRHLYSVGASTISHGVAGASMSGLSAAATIVGAKSTEELLGPADGSLEIHKIVGEASGDAREASAGADDRSAERRHGPAERGDRPPESGHRPAESGDRSAIR